jgi:KUP system potassium uptake protein
VVRFPALLLNYFGQGALLLREPHAVQHPFFHLAPDWALYPMVALATLATVIASQVISGAYSLTRQAIQLGYCPRLMIEHTGEGHRAGLSALINWTLYLAVIGLCWLCLQQSGRPMALRDGDDLHRPC